MIACVERPSPPRLCVVRWVGKSGFASIGVITYCDDDTDIKNGVVQLADNVLTGTKVPGIAIRGVQLGCCERCKAALSEKTP